MAERLFAEHGVDAVSLRQIMKVAGVNISLINYHFGTKEGLLRAIFAKRIEPLNQKRLAMLEEAESSIRCSKRRPEPHVHFRRPRLATASSTYSGIIRRGRVRRCSSKHL